MVRRPTSRNDHGFTLVELIVATSVLGLVLLLVYGTLDAGVRQAVETESRTRIQTDVRTAADGFVRDLRQAYTGDPSTTRVASMSATQITFYSPDKATPFHLRRISYRITGTRLERSVTVSSDADGYPWVFGAAGTYVPVLENVRNTTLFTYRDSTGAATTTAGQVAIVDLTLTVDADTARAPLALSYTTSVDLRGVT